MQIVLARYLNKRMIRLDQDTTTEHVGILRRSGEYRYVRWLGFIDREQAKTAGKPVKLEIARVGRLRGYNIAWEDVPTGSHVQGCLTRRGAFAVVEPMIRVV